MKLSKCVQDCLSQIRSKPMNILQASLHGALYVDTVAECMITVTSRALPLVGCKNSLPRTYVAYVASLIGGQAVEIVSWSLQPSQLPGHYQQLTVHSMCKGPHYLGCARMQLALIMCGKTGLIRHFGKHHVCGELAGVHRVGALGVGSPCLAQPFSVRDRRNPHWTKLLASALPLEKAFHVQPQPSSEIRERAEIQFLYVLHTKTNRSNSPIISKYMIFNATACQREGKLATWMAYLKRREEETVHINNMCGGFHVTRALH